MNIGKERRMEVINVRPARLDEVDWIADLSSRVQDVLTASGSRQQIGPLPLEMVESSVQAGRTYVLEASEGLLGSVLVDPITPSFPLPLDRWDLAHLEGPLWYLHTLMLEPQIQERGLDLVLLEGVKRYVVSDHCGTIILTCWACDQKLRESYQRAKFTFHGIFAEIGYEIAVFLFPDQKPANRLDQIKAAHPRLYRGL